MALLPYTAGSGHHLAKELTCSIDFQQKKERSKSRAIIQQPFP
jgi:hypothetical protein